MKKLTLIFFQNRFIYLILGFCLIIFSETTYSWSLTGHQVIAMIAYDRLNPVAKHRIDNLTQLMFRGRSGKYRFIQASMWPDLLRLRDIRSFDRWHYINLPYVHDDIQPEPLYDGNVIWGLEQSQKVLLSRQSTSYQKAVFLSFLVHLVGDIHQPMHCITYYSSVFPDGDRGGNEFEIVSPYGKNLHQLWDNGVGLFLFLSNGKDGYYSRQQFARQIVREEPEQKWRAQIDDLSIKHWAQQSYDDAKQYAYDDIKPGEKISRQYLRRGQQIVKQQLALAAYRLARLCNDIFATEEKPQTYK